MFNFLYLLLEWFCEWFEIRFCERRADYLRTPFKQWIFHSHLNNRSRLLLSIAAVLSITTFPTFFTRKQNNRFLTRS